MLSAEIINIKNWYLIGATMVKKVINIGVEGNDASGDPIREAFNKVNENFNELYSAFGKGDGISITALEEGPDDVIANSILIADASGTQYLSKTLEGQGGIEIINSDPSKLVIVSSSASLAGDPSPALANNMDALGFNIYRLGNPDQAVANSENVNIDSFAINKGYADARYVNVAGDTLTGHLNAPPGAVGTQVPRAQEVVKKIGGLSNQMSGPLILSSKIKDTDNPLTAATKEYVDVSSYTSRTNLYVSTQGSDDQFDIPLILRGRSMAYAFKTVSAACRYAKTLIDEAPITVAITVKDITYSNGAFVSQAKSIVPVDDYFVLSISNDGQQTDPRDASDIRPGQVIKGKISKAIVRILEIIPGVADSKEQYKVVYETEQELITDLGGEPLEYGNPTKDTQITIFIESGNYYEHYPIRVPPNVSIIGDELRRTIIRPKPGKSASWAIDTYFRRDLFFDIDLPITDRLYGYHYLTDTSQNLYSGTVSSPGNYKNASFILLQNKDFMIEEVIAYINTVWRGLSYDETACRRDTGYIIDALAYDIVFGSNFASIAAGRAYYRGNQAAAVLGADKTATLESLDELLEILLDLISDTAAVTSVQNNIQLIKNIINTGLTAVPEIVWPAPSSIDQGFLNARNLIFNNKLYIQAEISRYIDIQLEENKENPSSIWYNININGSTCTRDVGLIIDALVYDLTYGGNLQTVDAAKAYYSKGNSIIASNEIQPTRATYAILQTIVYAIATGSPFSGYQTNIPRVGGSPGTAAAGDTAEALIEVIRTTLDNNGTTPATVVPSLLSVSSSLVTDFNSIFTAKSNIINEVIDYINENHFFYDEALCRRDLGLIIDAIGYDLFYGGYYRTLEAGNSFFLSASALVVITDQLDKTTAAFNHLGVIAQRIVQKLPITTSYQNAYNSYIPQITTMVEIAEEFSQNTVEDLITFLINIITEDVSINPPKENNELDVFLMNDATIIRNLSCQEHGGFMCVLDPLGQILSKSPYVQTSSSFSRSINDRIFAGGMFVDAFAGNVQAQITERVSDSEVLVDGLDIRLPLLPCAFYINGVRFQVDLITEYNDAQGTARVHINPDTPDDPDYTLIEDSTRLFLPSTSIEFLSAGNNSMLCNDYTQLNDLGYGLVAINGGLLEAVGVFTYYNQISYFADTGGQIRSVGGSSAHGQFGLVAANSYPLEIPDEVYLLRDMVIGASVYSPFDHYTGVGGINLSGTGVQAKFNIIVNTTSYIVSINTPGVGYNNGNQIIILGNEFGGVAGINDVTITIDSVDVGGAITSISATGTVPDNAPVNDFYNRKDDVALYINNLTTEFQVPNGSELEVVFGTAPNREIYRYLINNASEVLDLSGLPVPPTGKIYRLNLASGGLGAGATGIKDALADGARVNIRQNTSLIIYDINRETATRPSTALVFDESSQYVNRVIAISNLSSKIGTFTWNNITAVVTSENHGLTFPPVGILEIYLVFLGGTNGNPSRGYYQVQTIPNGNTFTVTTTVPTSIFSEGAVTWGTANGEVEAQIKEPFRAINMTSFYDVIDQQAQPFTTTITRAFSDPINQFSCLSTTNLSVNLPIKFTDNIGNVIEGITYYVKDIIDDTKFTVSTTPNGVTFILVNETKTVYATSDIVGSNYYTWGVTGSYKFAIRDLSSYEAERIERGTTNGFPIIIGWRGKVHQITRYISSEQNGSVYAVIELDNLTGTGGLYEPVGYIEGGWDNTVNLKGVLPKDSPGNVTIQISTVRVTGHDMLEVGTGSYSQTNFPSTIFGRPDKDPDQAAEVLEIGKGRCFFVTSDQDGNFRVGDFFQVDQGTGTVTFSSSIAISNLDGLGFKRGVAIAEFSVDDSMFDNATDSVPTEQAVRTYIDRRLGLTHNGAVINPATGRLIPANSDSGFMALNGKLSMRADMNMGGFKIANLLSPASGSDAATKDYADTKLALTGGTMLGQINMGTNKITNLGTPTANTDATTKKYVDDLAASQNELRELAGVSLPNPITGITSNSLFVFNGTNFTWGDQAGDVLFTLATNTLTSTIQPGKIINSMVSNTAAIDQSKLALSLATAVAAAPTGTSAQKQAASGLSSFDTSAFTVTDGFVSLKANGITLANLPQIGADTVLGNSSASTTTPSAITFSTVVQEGGALFQTQFTSNGALIRTGATTFSTLVYKSDYVESVAGDKGTLVLRDISSGGFGGSTINATTQFNVGGNKAIGNSGTSPNQYLELYSPQGNLFLASRSNATSVYGSWSLASGATLEATYAADIAEYYQGDKIYEPGTVLMIGGEFDVTLASGEGTTKVAGVISNNAAYIMNGNCPGDKNLVALQGRVPCKVIGKVEKGDLMVVGIVPGVAMASADPKPGSIIGKALQNYDSDHVGTIEVMVGKH